MPDRAAQIKALSSDVRLEILRLLKEPKANFPDQMSADPEEVGVCMHMIAERVGLSPPTVTRHVDLLRQARFITVEKRHRWSYCARNEAELSDYHAWLGEVLLDD